MSIRLAVMAGARFPLSLRNVEDQLHERRIEISHEIMRFWWRKLRRAEALVTIASAPVMLEVLGIGNRQELAT